MLYIHNAKGFNANVKNLIPLLVYMYGINNSECQILFKLQLGLSKSGCSVQVTKLTGQHIRY